MKTEEYIEYKREAIFEEKSDLIACILASYDYEKLKKLLKCNDKIARTVFDYYKNYDNSEKYPALFTYDGIAYKYLAANTLESASLEYLDEHLYIMSGLYGILRPFDGIKLYRLDAKSAFKINDMDIYQYFENDIREFIKDEDVIINLASKEYSRMIEMNLAGHTKYINVEFKELDNGKLKTKATLAKMARGSMVNYMAKNKINEYELLKNFNELNFEYDENLSDAENFVFIRKK